MCINWWEATDSGLTDSGLNHCYFCWLSLKQNGAAPLTAVDSAIFHHFYANVKEIFPLLVE